MSHFHADLAGPGWLQYVHQRLDRRRNNGLNRYSVNSGRSGSNEGGALDGNGTEGSRMQPQSIRRHALMLYGLLLQISPISADQ
jgi:hypothetical protein